MQLWNMGNTTARNPLRLREALKLFVATMSGRPFTRVEQLEFQKEMIEAGLVDSERLTGDDGGRKFASAFKQLGFVTNWANGRSWDVTPVGTILMEHPELEEMIFLRQLLKYQIPSPLEKGKRVESFHVRPFRLLLRFLKRAHEEGLIGLTKHEIGIYVINVLDERDNAAFENAIVGIKRFRNEYNAYVGSKAKVDFATAGEVNAASAVGVLHTTLKDYADSNGRYALMTGLLALRGNKLIISESRLPLVDAILSDGTTFIPDNDYLTKFYDPDLPSLPTDNVVFIRSEIKRLERSLAELAGVIGEPLTLSATPLGGTLSELHGYEIRLRDELRRVREIQFYRTQCSPTALDEIEDLLESINQGGFLSYAPAYLEWAIWRLFLAINELVGVVSDTRGFKIDEDMNPVHHAKGGAADLTFTYNDFKLVCEMTLTSSSRQFAAEGEPVTRHVFKAIEASDDKPVYGLFVAKKLDPNTVDAFHNAQYWQNWTTSKATPIIALEIKNMIALIQCMKSRQVRCIDIRELLDRILELQSTHPHGPAWYKEYSKLYDEWVKN